MIRIVKILLVLFVACMSLHFTACKHEPVMPPSTKPPVDTTGNNTTDTLPCHPDTVYFGKQILPMLVSNCALSGCHDDATASDGVVLTSYQKVMQTADIRPFNPKGSDLYEMITESDPDKRMPPPPHEPLSQQNINLIKKWIEQGAKDLYCKDDCDTLNVKWGLHIQPLVQHQCVGCHNSFSASGNVVLDSYGGVKQAVNTGKLWGAVSHAPGFKPMPNGGKLNDCELKQIEKWIENGALEN